MDTRAWVELASDQSLSSGHQVPNRFPENIRFHPVPSTLIILIKDWIFLLQILTNMVNSLCHSDEISL